MTTDQEQEPQAEPLSTPKAAEAAGVDVTETPRPIVPLVLGQVVMTPGALDALMPWQLRRYLDRHQAGDWGCVCPEDAEVNLEAVREGYRVLSAYPIDPDKPCKGYGENCVWIITEADRSVTTFLLPDEY